MTPERLEYLANIVADARKLTDYEGSPIQIFMKIIDELRLDAVNSRAKLVKAEASRAKLDSVLYFASLIADTPRGTEHLLLANEVIAHGPDIHQLMLALREYRGEETK